MRQLGFWGARVAQNGPFRPPGRQNPRLTSPRIRPEKPEKAGGEGSEDTPLFPGLLGPLQAAVGVVRGRVRPQTRTPACPPPSGRIPFHPQVHPREASLPPPFLAGFMR